MISDQDLKARRAEIAELLKPLREAAAPFNVQIAALEHERDLINREMSQRKRDAKRAYEHAVNETFAKEQERRSGFKRGTREYRDWQIAQMNAAFDLRAKNATYGATDRASKLRRMTVENGCTPAEAAIAASKLAKMSKRKRKAGVK